MKGFIVALIIFVLIISSLFFYNFYMNDTFSELTDSVEEIEKHLTELNYQKAHDNSKKLYDMLSKKSDILYLITDREPLNNMITESARLLSFAKSEDEAEANASLSALKVILTELEKQTLYKKKNPRK